ncbi:hypothetical protein ACEN9D_17865 [Pseudomonas sp. CT11-2]|uniref:hypothetical protein n=1 Tax=unclassified Pseudomonas TaxID=196821 RepID=UPI00216001A2|nr:hypothetical protein [Pseudomonas sp. B21-019]UVM33327.1 hypothetical protein LOY36_00955 [Pseudomonas sp. B21-019]
MSNINQGKAAGGVDRTELPTNKNIAPPVVDTPTKNDNVRNPVKFSGTALPGWQVVVVKVPIDGTELTSVDAGVDGKWSNDVALEIGNYSAVAFQTMGRERSPFTDIFDFKVSDGQ